MTPNQSINQSLADGGGDTSTFAAPTPLKKRLNISESTRNFMSEQVSRILQESVMKQNSALAQQKQQPQQPRQHEFQQPLPPKRRLAGSMSPPPPSNVDEEFGDKSMDFPGYNYREKMKASMMGRYERRKTREVLMQTDKQNQKRADAMDRRTGR